MKYKILALAILLYLLALFANFMEYKETFKILFYLSLIVGVTNIMYAAIFVYKENKRIIGDYFSKKKNSINTKK
jgi:hypothetical protein